MAVVVLYRVDFCTSVDGPLVDGVTGLTWGQLNEGTHRQRIADSEASVELYCLRRGLR